MKSAFELWFARRIIVNAIKIALVVGTALNAINQGGALIDGRALDWWRLVLNYVVPYLVSSYSAVRNEQARSGNE